MSKPGGLSNAWSSTTLKPSVKTRLKALLSQAYISKRLLKQMKFSAYFIKFIGGIRRLSFQNQFVNKVSFVNKYKINQPNTLVTDS